MFHSCVPYSHTVVVHFEMYMYNFQPNQKQIFGFISFTLDKTLNCSISLQYITKIHVVLDISVRSSH